MTTNHIDAKGRALVRYAADLVVFCGDAVLLIERGTAPYAGRLALPGGHVEHGETSRGAAARELAEETGLTIPASRLRRVGLYDDPDRDPRARVVAVAYTTAVLNPKAANGGGDAARAEWLDIETALKRPLAFDHERILTDAYELLLNDLIAEL